MNRNPVMPFIIIMVFGIGLMFLLSFKGLGDAKDLAKEKEGGEKTEEKETASSSPEDIYKQNCISCHGNAYQGGVGPALKGVGDRLSEAEVKEVITNGRGAMPPGLVEESNLDAMAKYIHGLK
ncbi:cytochrome c550 [Peribacillus sp. NPDC097675]|uniref:cytochrome c550 n=1 Tax=Peribacillus sp. NPDC097675 TaxID=3390618 RepID=UPI003CFE1FB6